MPVLNLRGAFAAVAELRLNKLSELDYLHLHTRPDS